MKYLNPKEDLENRIEDLLIKLSLDEKFRLLYGYYNNTTFPIDRLNVPSLRLSDGPHGCATHKSDKLKNTYFPAAVGLASTWNLSLAEEFGKALAEEFRASNRHVVLGPGINIQRSPLCGRNFEYLSEDPFLASKIVVPIIQGIQSMRISACVKHFCCNNQETMRTASNSIVDERTLNEIYFPAFKAAITEAKTWMIMGSYNLVNEKWVYENKEILGDTLFAKWKSDTCVISDWDATHALKEPDVCIKAGLSLEMPKPFVYKTELVKKAFDERKFTESDLDNVIRRLLRVMFRVGLFDPVELIPQGSRNTKEHLDLAMKIAEESFVLLKNKDNILPLNPQKIKKIALKGIFSKFQPNLNKFGGSSVVVAPTKIVTIKMALEERIKSHGYNIQIVHNPKDADVVLYVTGILQFLRGDCEGLDREWLNLSSRIEKKIKKIAKKNHNTIVILYNGGPIAMDNWIDSVKGILEVWQPHQIGGHAIVNTIFGDVNPSGKLPMTFPKSLQDSPAHQTPRQFSSPHINLIKVMIYESYLKGKEGKADVYYDEGIFVGYRHFDKFNVTPLFPFGFGLSYTSFEYSNLKLEYDGKLPMIISFDIKNIGLVAGAEIAQLYVSDLECSVPRPIKELKGFAKVFLQPQEIKTIKIKLDKQDFSFYDVKTHQWVVEDGDFKILIGKSSRDIVLSKIVQIKNI